MFNSKCIHKYLFIEHYFLNDKGTLKSDRINVVIILTPFYTHIKFI